MLKFPLWFLLILVAYSTPATAACNLILADVPALTECIKSQGYTIADQAEDISLLRKELNYLKEFQERDRKVIDQLRDRVFELRGDVALLGLQKAKPARK
jgi:hypothetical protein